MLGFRGSPFCWRCLATIDCHNTVQQVWSCDQIRKWVPYKNWSHPSCTHHISAHHGFTHILLWRVRSFSRIFLQINWTCCLCNQFSFRFVSTYLHLYHFFLLTAIFLPFLQKYEYISSSQASSILFILHLLLFSNCVIYHHHGVGYLQ